MSQQLEVPVDKRRDVLDPVPELLELGARAPLFRDTITGVFDWMAVGRGVVREILGDAERFSSNPPPDGDGRRMAPQPGNLLQSDPPSHTRLRRFVVPLFTVRRMQRLAPTVERIVAERLDLLERSGRPADLMRLFARPVAGLTCAALLGLPRDDLTELSRLADHRASPHSPRRDPASRAYFAHILRLVVDRRRDPGDDLLGTLIREHGDELDDEELAGLCEGIISGTLENSAEMLGLSTLALIRHPDQAALLRERPELMERAVEELLRYVSVVAAVSPRTAQQDVTIGGETIKAGEVVACSVFAANRCPHADGAADGLDITREPGSHLALGHGIHFCLGAALARMQLRVALTGLLERFPGLRLGVGVDELRFRLLAPQYGVETLPVIW
ncbi:cytochrome P450 [Streptomyces sp. NPDC049687]|uniref:cytochrome P450 n=1 Tax=Streptomyces sp. NPDC049687 TaxID=3365596 RepID=UPI0037BB15DB